MDKDVKWSIQTLTYKWFTFQKVDNLYSQTSIYNKFRCDGSSVIMTSVKNSVLVKAFLWTSVCNELLDAMKLFPCHVEFIIARFDCSACTTGNTEIQPVQKCLFVFKNKDRKDAVTLITKFVYQVSFYNMICNLFLTSGYNKRLAHPTTPRTMEVKLRIK